MVIRVDYVVRKSNAVNGQDISGPFSGIREAKDFVTSEREAGRYRDCALFIILKVESVEAQYYDKDDRF